MSLLCVVYGTTCICSVCGVCCQVCGMICVIVDYSGAV